jgi:hypothetical protein
MTRESTAVDDQCDVALLDRQQLEIDNDGAQNDAHIDAPDQWFGGKRTIRRSKQSQSAGRAPVAVALAALANSTVHGTVLVSQRAAASLDARRIAIAIDRSAAMRVHGAQVHELLEGALEAGAYADVLLLASASRTEPPLVVPLTEVLSSSALEDTFGAHELHDSIQQSDWITSLVGTHYEAMLLVTERGASDGDSGESTQAASPLFKNDSMPAWNAVASSTPLLLHFVDGHRPLDMRQTALKRVHAITTASDTKSVLAQLGAIATKRDAFGNIEMRLVAETSETLQNPAESLKALAGAYVLHLQRLQIDAMEQFRVAESIGVVTRVASRIAPFWEFQRDRLHEMRDVAMQSYVANSHSNGHQHQPLALFETSSTGTRTSACVGLAFAMILWIVTKIIFIPLE